VIDLSFNVAPGEVFGYLGPNGAGKTTTIRTLLDFIRPTAGRARVFGLDTREGSNEIHRRTRLPPRRPATGPGTRWPSTTPRRGSPPLLPEGGLRATRSALAVWNSTAAATRSQMGV